MISSSLPITLSTFRHSRNFSLAALRRIPQPSNSDDAASSFLYTTLGHLSPPSPRHPTKLNTTTISNQQSLKLAPLEPDLLPYQQTPDTVNIHILTVETEQSRAARTFRYCGHRLVPLPPYRSSVHATTTPRKLRAWLRRSRRILSPADSPTPWPFADYNDLPPLRLLRLTYLRPEQ